MLTKKNKVRFIVRIIDIIDKGGKFALTLRLEKENYYQ
jgi:hypothetical protein